MNGTMKNVGLLEKNVRKLLRKFRKSLNRAESVDYCCTRRESKKKTVATKEKEIQ